MHAGIAPMTVEAMLAQGRARSAGFEQPVACLDGYLRCENLCLGDRHRCGGYVVFVACGLRSVQRPAGTIQQGISGLLLDFEGADPGYRVGIVSGFRLP